MLYDTSMGKVILKTVVVILFIMFVLDCIVQMF